ncbi:MAG: carbohydrate kinase family protein [Propionibacteriaceae bacterium]|nr:carbohydrate kinase family protein [Propionibacteriaceae bacterium]
MTGIAVVGHLCVDIRPELPGPPVLEPGVLAQVGPAVVTLGGAVANTGRVAALLGAPVAGWGAIGRDDFGGIVGSHLARAPGFTFHPQVVDAGTAYTVVVEPPGTDRTFWHHPGTNALLDLSRVELGGVDLLHFGYPSLMPGVCADAGEGLVALYSRAVAAGVVTSLDLAWVDPLTSAGAVDWPAFLQRVLPLVDVLSPSWADLASALGLPREWNAARGRELVGQLLDWGAGVVVLTAGEEGSLLGAAGADRLARLARYPLDLAAWAGARTAAPARPVSRIGTTTGAGDAATAGLLVALREGRDPDATLAFCADVASAVIEQGGSGGFTGLP